MTKTDVMRLLTVFKTAYPGFYARQSRDDALAAVDLWADMFADDEPKLVFSAAKALIATRTNTFPPNIGEIKEQMRKLSAQSDMTEQEAWLHVSRALKNSSYGAREEFEKLPSVVKKLVGSPNQLREWAMMDAETVQSVVASNFQRSYRVRHEQEKDWEKLPSAVKDYVAELADRAKMQRLESPLENPLDFEDKRRQAIQMISQEANT